MIYFDNSATTKPYKEVIDSFVKVSSDFFANPSSLHQAGDQAEKLLSQGRRQIAQLLHVKPSEIFLTSGGTESNNLAIKGAAWMHRNRGKHIITTAIEHPSVRETVNQLSELGFEVTFIPVNKEGRININDIENAISQNTILVSVMHVNNEVGTIQPISEIGKLLANYPKILFHVDNVQGVGKVPLDLHSSGVDLCSFSGHKFHGVKGTGILYIREGVKISPLLSGGGQEQNIRSGTENVAGAVAMAKALRMTMEKQSTGLKTLAEMKDVLMKELSKIEELVVHTPLNHSAPHIINFSIKGLKGEVFVHALEEKNIYVSTTSACSSKKKGISHTLQAMGIADDIAKGAIRLSLSYNNTMDEALYVISAIKTTVNNLKEVLK